MSRDSRYLASIFRHETLRIGLSLDSHGWARIDELVGAMKANGRPINQSRLFEMAATDDKCRFTISEDGRRIRAAQGHSIEIDLALPEIEPPRLLFHGTEARNLDAIFRNGLKAGRRRHVHFLADRQTAIRGGGSHGKTVVLCVHAARLRESGHALYGKITVYG